ncbi:MAG: M61 family metallopeptidase, partial [Candidatus Ranarchaeia archaeon]
RYVFIFHFKDGKYGGLEHQTSNVCLYASHKMRKRSDYVGFLNLVSHEFFHLWNGRRIRPEPLIYPQLDQEVYTRMLWQIEGWTAYYDGLLLARGGTTTPKEYLSYLEKKINRHLLWVGRKHHSLAEASFDAWIKYYRPDENLLNTSTSYYDKGSLVGLLLDLHIRKETNNKKSLDTLLLHLWHTYGKHNKGYPESIESLQHIFEEVLDIKLGAFIQNFILGVEELPLVSTLELVGITLTDTPKGSKKDSDTSLPSNEDQKKTPWVGIVFDKKNPKLEVKRIIPGSPANKAGIYVKDEIIALDGVKVSGLSFDERLEDYKPKEEITISLFRDGTLSNTKLKLSENPSPPNRLEFMEDPSDQQKQFWLEWTKIEYPIKKDS